MRRAGAVVCLSVSIMLLVACGSSGPTASRAVASTQGGSGGDVQWRGATITGLRAAEAMPWIEAGWQAAQRSFGASPEPLGWHIELQSALIRCQFYDGNCGGLFIGHEQRIVASWSVPAAKRDGLMAHEFCRFIFFHRTGNAQHPQCERYYAGDRF